MQFGGSNNIYRKSGFSDFLQRGTGREHNVRLSSLKVACSSVVPTTSTGNPASVYTNCETALARGFGEQRNANPMG
jgi:hypothetical protein